MCRHADRQRVNHSHSNGSVVGAGYTATVEEIVSNTMETSSENRQNGTTAATVTTTTKKRDKKELDKEREAAEYLQRLELDTKRLRADLQNSRHSEQELRLQVILFYSIIYLIAFDKNFKNIYYIGCP